MFDIENIKRNVSRFTKPHPSPNPIAPNESSQSSQLVQTGSSEKRNTGLLGPSVEFSGELSGHEDICIEGLIDGTVHFPNNQVVVGPKGRVNGDIFAETIVIAGEVNGNLLGNAKVLLKQTGNVLGDIKAHRVSLEDGAVFKGSIEMQADVENDKMDELDSAKDIDNVEIEIIHQ